MAIAAEFIECSTSHYIAQNGSAVHNSFILDAKVWYYITYITLPTYSLHYLQRKVNGVVLL